MSGNRFDTVAMIDRLAADDIQAVVDGYRAGKTARELAEKFKISTSSVNAWSAEQGVRGVARPPD